MRSFRTREGRCVVRHGEIHLESIGIRGRLRRGLRNAKLAHQQRYERGILRFVAVLGLALLSIGQFVARLVFGDWRLVVVVFGLVVVLVGVVYLLGFVWREVRQLFVGYTDDRTIPLRTVESVDPRPKRTLRSPAIVVHYDEYGEAKKRRIQVCTRTPLAEGEFETAKTLLLDDNDLPITPV